MDTKLTASALGLLITWLDVVRTRKKEARFLWSNSFRLTFVRILYVLARYLALPIHIGNITFSRLMTAKFSVNKQDPEYFCMSLLAFQNMSSQSMLLILHFILILRVFALYKRSLLIGVPLSLLVIGRFSAGLLYGLTRPPPFLRFSGPCLDEKALSTSPVRNPFLLSIHGEFLIQFILYGLVWKRIVWDLRIFSFYRPSLLSVLKGNSLNVFMGITVAMIAMSVSAVKKGMAGVFVFPLWITFLSIAGTRLILSIQIYPSEETPSELAQTTELITVTDGCMSSVGRESELHQRKC
ncbi:hypothetical protein GYMLUDRAFT_753715 [Collybiopsis luxurians FD-317 M1]|uniref:Uncharacterized protein n=1 Tax=Collybiopsis luxurians FD-317 M1 TaxID=944289 RepID=A0A0D0CQB5_9AGAR|nr:hypothetical protein GYMLUDRAFT_753715 [Collybiopsis luxurians FD-317 M1]